MKLALAIATVASLALAVSAHADTGGVNSGVLTCNVSSGWGFVFGSSRDLNCTYSSNAGQTERYSGKINKYGVDVGYQQGGVMVWAVIAPAGSLAPGGLSGGYGGVTAGASVGLGANANALVGGSNNTVSLQPISIEGTTGLNVAAGVASINLSYVPS